MMEGQIRDYIIESKIGQGGMGSVYLATHVHLDTKAALKILLEQYSNNATVKSRFVNEAKLLHKLRHPNIVDQKEFFEDNGRMVLVMEYVDGRGLDQMIGKEVGPFPWDRALPLFRQILEGIGYAHSKGIIHRDIKPANILVTHDGEVKVTDLGIAKLAGQRGVTQTGSQLGTPYYMSPEQVVGVADINHLTDIYSLGVTLYEMLAGRLPFNTEETVTDFAISSCIVNGVFKDPRDFYPHIPEWLVNVIRKAMSKDRQDRYQSCEELLHALNSEEEPSFQAPPREIDQRSYAKTVISPVEATPVPQISERSGSRIHPGLIAVGALLVIVILILLIPKIGQSSRPAAGIDTGVSSPQSQPQANDIPEDVVIETYPSPRADFATSFSHCDPISSNGNNWTYVADNMIDNNWNTAWAAEYNQDNSWFTIFLNQESTIGRISIVPGFVKQNAVVDDLFQKNHRLRRVTIEFPSGREVSHTFADSPTMQDIQISPVEIADRFTVRIEGIYTSTLYNDLAVSELRVASE